MNLKGPKKKKKYPANLFSVVFDRDIPENSLPPNWESTLSRALDTFPCNHEKEVLLYYFRDDLRMAEIGSIFGFSGERARQLVNRAIYSLRHPARLWILLHSGEQNSSASETHPAIDATPPPLQPFSASLLLNSISELDLGARAFNCLFNAGITTVDALSHCTESDLLSLRGFGSCSLSRVKSSLANAGLSLMPPRPFLPDERKPVSSDLSTQNAQLLEEVNQLRAAIMELTVENTRLSSLLTTTEAERDLALLEIAYLKKS